MDDVLEVKNMNASWNGTPVLHAISLAIHSGQKGEVVCLTGPNGGGKSTLLTLLAGISVSGLKIDSAETYPSLNGKKLLKYARKQVAAQIAYLTQSESSAWNYKVRDVVLMGRFSHTGNTGNYSEHDDEVVERVIKELNINSLADRTIFSLSGGEFQKVRIARSLAQEPSFLLLDEPVANLDFGYQTELLETICSLTKNGDKKRPGVLISIHDLNTAARFADKLVLLPKASQTMIVGTPEEVLTPKNLHAIYGIEFGTFIHPEYKCVQVYSKK